MVREIEEKEGKRKEEEIPEELRLAYRDELGKKEGEDEPKVDVGKARAADPPTAVPSSSSPLTEIVAAPVSAPALSAPVASTPRPTRTIQAPRIHQVGQQSPDRSIALIDTCIYGIVAALLYMVLRKFA